MVNDVILATETLNENNGFGGAVQSIRIQFADASEVNDLELEACLAEAAVPVFMGPQYGQLSRWLVEFASLILERSYSIVAREHGLQDGAAERRLLDSRQEVASWVAAAMRRLGSQGPILIPSRSGALRPLIANSR
jgi:hypothetical protein